MIRGESSWGARATRAAAAQIIKCCPCPVTLPLPSSFSPSLFLPCAALNRISGVCVCVSYCVCVCVCARVFVCFLPQLLLPSTSRCGINFLALLLLPNFPCSPALLFPLNILSSLFFSLATSLFFPLYTLLPLLLSLSSFTYSTLCSSF